MFIFPKGNNTGNYARLRIGLSYDSGSNYRSRHNFANHSRCDRLCHADQVRFHQELLASRDMSHVCAHRIRHRVHIRAQQHSPGRLRWSWCCRHGNILGHRHSNDHRWQTLQVLRRGLHQRRSPTLLGHLLHFHVYLADNGRS